LFLLRSLSGLGSLFRSAGRPRAARKSENEAHEKENQEDEEENLRDSGGRRSDSTKPEYRRDYGDNKENGCPIKHTSPPD
tara:strand:+ start:177 stop:416 length:240 start_codon:yes stop_codon:yes gene_type:complete